MASAMRAFFNVFGGYMCHPVRSFVGFLAFWTVDFCSGKSLTQTVLSSPKVNEQKNHQNEKEDQMKRHVESQQLAAYSSDVHAIEITGEVDQQVKAHGCSQAPSQSPTQPPEHE